MTDSARRGAWAILVVVLVVLFLVLSQCDGSNGSKRVGAVKNSAGPAEPLPAVTDTQPAPARTRTTAPTTAPAPTPTDSGPDDGNGASDGTSSLTVDGDPLLPLDDADGVGRDGDLTLLSGKRALARNMRVLTVPADEGFWIGTGREDRVWVALTGPPPESPYTVLPGDEVSFTGRIVPNGSGYARRSGVTRAEGAASLTAQRQHINVAKGGLELFHP
jgi:hypothetical protein